LKQFWYNKKIYYYRQ